MDFGDMAKLFQMMQQQNQSQHLGGGGGTPYMENMHHQHNIQKQYQHEQRGPAQVNYNHFSPGIQLWRDPRNKEVKFYLQEKSA